MTIRNSRVGRSAVFRLTPLAFLLASGTAFTQQVAAPINAPSEKLDEVTVTARRVSERAIDVPLTLTTLTGAVLQDTSSTNVRDVINLTPGMTATTGGAEANVVITIRGLPDLSGSPEIPNVAVFLDGVYQQNRSAISIGLLDLLRIEVVKGPVSALYGRNAYAGAINYVTTPPQGTFEASAGATFGDYGLRGAKFSIGGPLGAPEVLGRLVFAHEEFGGTYRDPVTGLHAGGYRKNDVLGTLTVKPTDRFTINASAYYGDDFFDVPAATYLNNNCASRSASPVSPGQFTQLCGKIDPNQNPVEVAQIGEGASQTGNQRRVYANSLKLSYDLTFADISTLFGYNKVTEVRYADFTFHRNGIPFIASNGQIYNARELFGANDNTEDGSIELRLASKQNQPLRWATGFYYFNSRTTSTTLIGADASTLPPGVNFTGTGALFQTSNGQFSTSNLTAYNTTDRVVSPFGSLEYDVLPALTGLVEARRTKEDKGYDILRNAFIANTVRPFGANGNGVVDFKFNNYRTTLRYKLGPDAIVYASLANGTKAGGINQRATTVAELAFQPETNTTYEVGAKAALLDNRLRVGVSLFDVLARNLQISGPSDDPTNLGLVTKNFGRVKSQGIDLDIAFVPVRGLTLSAGAEFANPVFGRGTYDYSNAAVCAQIPACASRITTVSSLQGTRTVVNLQGLQVSRVSKVTGSLAAQYNGQINDRWGYFARADFRYESKQYSAPIQYNYWDARKVVNLNAGISTDRYRFTAFVKNLTNDNTPEVASPNGLINGGATPYVAYLPARRTFGLTAAIDY